MPARDDLRFSDPRNRLANILDVLAGIGNHQIARIDLGEFFGFFCRDKGLCLRCPDAVIGVNLSVMDAPNPRLHEIGLRHSVAAHQFAEVTNSPEVNAVWA